MPDLKAKLSRERRAEIITAIRAHFQEHHDDEIGDLKAGLLLDFFLKTLGPPVYNEGIRDAQTYLRDKVEDLDGEYWEPAE